MKKAVYCKTMGNLRNRIYVKLLKSEKDYLKKKKLFDNDLFTIR